ncbi:hypothetical protein ACERIM_15715 [Natrinema sp. H-ect1]|uniref:hypothetical protein n=1 Tax=Natrinema sp. H-ect1 TaxID=3242700 RepID=UPI00359D4CC4
MSSDRATRHSGERPGDDGLVRDQRQRRRSRDLPRGSSRCGDAWCPHTVTEPMKRALTLALTVAVIGGLAFMGAAGTAAAQADANSSVDVDQDSDAVTVIDTDQENNNQQTQIATSYSSSDVSTAKTTAIQGQAVEQENENEVEDTTTISGNYADVDSDANASDDDDNSTDNSVDGITGGELVDIFAQLGISL